MKRIFLLLFIIVTVPAALASPIHSLITQQKLNDAGSELINLLSASKTFQANFTEQVFDEHQQPMQQNNGQVSIERPGKFRWTSEVPTRQIIIANGPTLWTYDVDLQQATKQPFSQDNGVTPANLLSGDLNDLQKQFAVTRAPSEKVPTQLTFTLKPKTQNDLFQSVTMTFEKNILTTMTVNNTLGQALVFSFDHVILNHPIDPRQFNFTPPAGVDVITQ